VERIANGDAGVFAMDAGQVRQVFENLFLNAMEAMGETGTLRIEVSTAEAPVASMTPYRPGGIGEGPAKFDSYAVVRVADSGPGIQSDHLEKLFYPFFTTKPNGSGVGLSMAKKIVDSHRGVIDVTTEPGSGTVFTVRLPRVSGSGETHA
jgi:signal transduction histidine kinase